MKYLLVTLIAFGLFLLTGCRSSDTPQPGPVTNAKSIIGTWKESLTYSQFNEDGTFRYATSLEGLAEHPFVTGEFWFEGGQLFFKEIEVHNVPPCGSVPAIYEVELLENGNLMLTMVEDECKSRVNSTAGEYKRAE